eukprot:SAG31_NODE_1755_length_7344_cov_7.207039_2_plen_102_part_00
MVDNDRVLALVVDVIGWNIQNRDSIFIHSWPQEPPKRRSGSGDRVLSREEVDAMDAGDPGPQVQFIPINPNQSIPIHPNSSHLTPWMLVILALSSISAGTS